MSALLCKDCSRCKGTGVVRCGGAKSNCARPPHFHVCGACHGLTEAQRALDKMRRLVQEPDQHSG